MTPRGNKGEDGMSIDVKEKINRKDEIRKKMSQEGERRMMRKREKEIQWDPNTMASDLPDIQYNNKDFQVSMRAFQQYFNAL